MNKPLFLTVLAAVVFQSCAFKKDILYFQDVTQLNGKAIEREASLIQPNDILQITVGSLIPEAASPYNSFANRIIGVANSTEMLQLQGYLVNPAGTIEFPILGTILVQDQSTVTLETVIKKRLIEGGHLMNPTVTVRVLNAKVTVLGEVNRPGTYSFLEQSLSIPQALGYAGDLTINGDRKEVVLIRESNGIRTVKKINLTQSSWMTDPVLQVRQNDILIVNPNIQKIKTAGLVGNTGTILTIASLLLSSIILITR
jgi:polysaccharide export outer membrane protein